MRSWLDFKKKPGSYGSGRRTRNYAKRYGFTGSPEEFMPSREEKPNSMRWRKAKNQSKPWDKKPVKHWEKKLSKPWEKKASNLEAKSWKKRDSFRPKARRRFK